MHYRYGFAILLLNRVANSELVFSAPKYCDMTENKGAYINIGPKYKLDFHQFDAVPHPNIRPMVRAPRRYLSASRLNTAD